jgi:hypothetical protein
MADGGSTVDLSAVGDIATNGALLNQAVARLVVLMQRFPDIVLPIANGGTGANNAAQALINLGAQAADPQLSSLIRQNSQSADYTLALTDGGYQIYHPVGDTNNRTWTIPANASVAFPIGSVVTFVNRVNTITIAITSDTLIMMGTGSTGSRSLAANGIATALKTGSTEWIISGVGLT